MNTFDELYKKHTTVIREISILEWRIERHPENKRLLVDLKQLKKDKEALQRVLRMFS